jgi:hypothetical protein
MAAIGTSNVTYTLIRKSKEESGRKNFRVALAFGNGTLTYPAGGVPLIAGSLGMNVDVNDLYVGNDHGSGYVFSFNKAGLALRMYEQNATTGALVEATGVAIAAQTLDVEVWGY